MLRANVGLSRKLSKDFNSTGFTINLEGEITAAVNDPETVMEQVKELFDLAEEALDLQIERAKSTEALAGRDESTGGETSNGHRPDERNGDHHVATNRSNGHAANGPSTNGNGRHRDEEPATTKQVNYLLNIGKRQNLSTAQLERKVAEILGRAVGLYDLTKQAAGVVIDAMSGGTGNGRARSVRA